MTARLFHNKASSFAAIALAVCFLSIFIPNAGHTQDARVAKAMAALKDQTTKLGVPKIEGREAVGGKDAPVLYFGFIKMNNNVALVDAVAKEGGQGIAATLFVKDGDEFIRVATTLAKPNKTGRAIGTVLDAGPALDALKSGKAYNGEVSVLKTTYLGSYEPITEASGAVIGAYFVGVKR